MEHPVIFSRSSSYSVWAQILDRPQQSLGLVLLPFHSFLPVNELPNGHATPLLDPCTEATEEYSASPYRVIFSVQSESWITVTNLLRFLPVDDPDLVRFIWASEETGFMHLYLVEALKRSNVDEEAAEADCSGEFEMFCLEQTSPLTVTTITQTIAYTETDCLAQKMTLCLKSSDTVTICYSDTFANHHQCHCNPSSLYFIINSFLTQFWHSRAS